jgi:hypothetical protein
MEVLTRRFLDHCPLTQISPRALCDPDLFDCPLGVHPADQEGLREVWRIAQSSDAPDTFEFEPRLNLRREPAGLSRRDKPGGSPQPQFSSG